MLTNKCRTEKTSKRAQRVKEKKRWIYILENWNFLKWDAFFTIRHYVPFGIYYIRHHFQSTFYHSTLCLIRFLLHSTWFPVAVFYFSMFCPCFVIVYHLTFCLFDVFLLLNVFSIDILSHSTFCPSTFLIVNVFISTFWWWIRFKYNNN